LGRLANEIEKFDQFQVHGRNFKFINFAHWVFQPKYFEDVVNNAGEF
jgi:hypothetical protein